ncbi:MAG: rhodanese-like domain-containing protein [Phycisphaerales bacterium]|nr:rhodanese-like domain-containing protein [Phycisphaerales bacterium]MCB9857160.1 rhodanese-like domain-containing protein [Phycisphaerales bacterium]MCB9861713.1 rhodanese-like domain-containing protein [Phycisphaerales bacterium]
MTEEFNPAGGESSPPANSPWWRRIVTVAIVLVVAACIQWHRSIGLAVLGRWHHWQTGADGVGVETARDWVRNGDLLIDVREPEEFLVSHLEGAISLPLGELLNNGLRGHSVDGRRVVVYCTIGRRSGDAAKRLKDDGVSAYNMIGGILQAANDAPDWIGSSGSGPSLHVWSEDYAWLAPPEFSTTGFSVAGD